jgi:hypothetical protein
MFVFFLDIYLSFYLPLIIYHKLDFILEDENFHIEMQLLREDNSSKEENERSTLLQYEKETKTDDDTSTGYGSESSILTEHCSWQNSCELISTNISNQVEKERKFDMDIKIFIPLMHAIML